MGSSQSRNRPDMPSEPRRGIRRRLEPLRRLSTLGRKAKRDRAQSSGPSSPKDKRPRTEEEVENENESGSLAVESSSRPDEPVDQSIPLWSEARGDGNGDHQSMNAEIEHTHSCTPSSSSRLPNGPGPSFDYPVRRPVSPSLNTCPLERLRTTSTPVWRSSARVIRRRSISIEPRSTVPQSSTSKDTPTIPPDNPTPPTHLSVRHKLRRTKSDPAIGTPLIPLDPPDTPAAHIRRLGVEQEFLEETVALLTEQLENSRREMVVAEAEATRAAERLRELEEEQARTPGAVMMIQGIAQTHMRVAPPRRLGRWRRGERDNVDRRIPFEEQASTITGLILVASLATANTLLSAERPRPRPNTVIEALMRRIQPSRAFAVDQLLGDPSVSSNPRTRRSRSITPAEPAAPSLDSLNMPAEFTSWLDTLQSSIREAMREFVEGTALPLSRTTSVQPLSSSLEPGARPDAQRRISAPPPQSSIFELAEETNEGVPQFHAQVGQSSNPHASGQSNRSLGVTTDEDGNRRLNFFRAHVFQGNEEDANAMVPCIFVGVRSTTQDPSTFGEDTSPFGNDAAPAPPARSTAAPTSTGRPPSRATSGPSASTSGSALPSSTSPIDPSGVAGPPSRALPADTSRPWGVPTSPNGGPEVSPSTSTEHPRPAPSRTQSLRSRLLALSPFSRQQQPQAETHQGPAGYALESVSSPERESPEATFIMYVIGGNYPRNHPVLRIPGLLTGEPLTDEEMTLIGELVGEVKPPTATAEEVEQSGLRVVDGGEIMGLVERKEIIDSSAERCLVCLSDFEPDEQCRILNCRHVFHKDCVDQWIKVGRNACPACRTEAVEKTKTDTNVSDQAQSTGGEGVTAPGA